VQRRLTNKFSGLFNTELIAVSKRHRSEEMTINTSVSHIQLFTHITMHASDLSHSRTIISRSY